MYNQHKFDPPDRLLKSVVGQLKAKQAENAPPPMPVVQQVSGLAKPANPAGGPVQAKQVETVPPPKPVDQQVSGQAKLTNPVGGNNPVVATIGGRLDTSDDHMDSSVHDVSLFTFLTRLATSISRERYFE